MQEGTHIILTAERKAPHLALARIKRLLVPAATLPPPHPILPVTPNHLDHQGLTPSPIIHLRFLFFSSKGWLGQPTWTRVSRRWRSGRTAATSNSRSRLPFSFPRGCFLPVEMCPPSLPLPSSCRAPFACVRVYLLAASLLI